MRSQDLIDIPAMLAESPLKPRRPGEERRIPERPRAATRLALPAEQAERNRLRGRTLDWLLIAAAVVIAASQLVQVTAEAFATPLEAVTATLAAPR